METKTEILSQKAANWWSNEIEQNAHNNFVQGLETRQQNSEYSCNKWCTAYFIII